MAVQGETFSTISEGLATTSYLVTGLTFGVTYEFKVESRNSYGYSEFSATLALICAFVPEPPLVITTTNAND